MKNCSFSGISPCHQETFTKQKSLNSVDENKKILLNLRTKIEVEDIRTICSHHEQILDIRFSQRILKCADPFQIHKGPVTKSLKVISLTDYSNWECIQGKVVPGEKLCPKCRVQAFQNTSSEVAGHSSEANVDFPDTTGSSHPSGVTGPSTLPPTVSSSSTTVGSSSTTKSISHNTTDSSGEPDASLQDVNAALAVLGETPVKKRGLSTKQLTRRSSRKLRSATQALKRKIETGCGVSVPDVDAETDIKRQKSDDLPLYKKLLEDLIAKFNDSSTTYNEKLQILTLSPFNIQRTQKEFGATNHMVKRARKLKDMCGVLGLPDKKKGKALDEETKAKVIEFFNQDEVSRICPGKKDYKTVRLAGTRTQHQKRLLLGNLKELYQKWNSENPDTKIGFSTFAMLRPQWCVLAGASGTHSVCVCTIHQNPKLMISALQTDVSYMDLMEKTVCSTEREECMMRRCKECPGTADIVPFLNSLEICDVVNEIEYKQWVTTDRTTLVSVKEEMSDFVTHLAEKLCSLTRHHYTAKAQSSYLKKLKEEIKVDEECIILGDFAENYSFIIQDAAQGFHWENSQATIHPFVAYYRTSDSPTIQHSSMCIISDCPKHSTAAVFTYQNSILDHMKSILPNLRKVHYFSDGCAGQYKNRYNFINLCHHQEDFQLECEWNFFATSHGKSACDGIGGTVKRLTAKASLQRTTSGQILTPLDMFNFCKESVQNIKVFYISEDDVNSSQNKLLERFSAAKTIQGTHQLHRIIPININQLNVFPLSQSTESRTVSICQLPTGSEIDDDTESLNELVSENFTVSSYVACLYQQKWWIGIVKEISDEYNDIQVSFMYPSGEAKQYSWPEKEDVCWVERNNVICNISYPSIASSSGRGYSFSDRDMKKVKDQLANKMRNK